jgi:DNA-binding GntR family transcriptional regulator
MGDKEEIEFDLKVSRGPMRDDIVRFLLKLILSGKITKDERLSASELEKQIPYTATPIREALLELHSLGMISMTQNKGARVLAFGRAQLAEFYAVRRLYECETARLSCNNVSRDTLLELIRQMKALPPQDDPRWLSQAAEFDIAVHRTLRKHCGIKRLTTDLDRFSILGEALRELLDLHTLAMYASYDSIVEVVLALKRRDSAGMVSAMHKHIGILADYAAQLLFKGR